MVARCHDRRLVGPRRADGRVDRRTSGGRRDRSRAGPPGRRRATLWAKRPIGAVRVPGLARALGARTRGWSHPSRRAHATASSIRRSRDRDELRRSDLSRRARYGGSSRNGVADRFSVDDHVPEWARCLPRPSACGGGDPRRGFWSRGVRRGSRKFIRRVVRDHRDRRHVTVAARARIERGVVMRLREAPDGRPRREHLAAALRETLVDERLVIPAGEHRLLERWLEDRLFGLGELAPLLRDDRVTEVMVNGTRGVWVELDGRLEETAIHFADPDEILVLIERLAAPLGRRIDLASPLVDARLPDGSHVHAVIPPISLVGPVLTIRRFAQRALSPDDLVRNGTLPPDAMAYLVGAVRERRSVLVSGGTSSGKASTSSCTKNATRVGFEGSSRSRSSRQSARIPTRSRRCTHEYGAPRHRRRRAFIASRRAPVRCPHGGRTEVRPARTFATAREPHRVAWTRRRRRGRTFERTLCAAGAERGRADVAAGISAADRTRRGVDGARCLC